MKWHIGIFLLEGSTACRECYNLARRTMHTVYLDWSGDWGFPRFDARTPILCLCAVVVDEAAYWRQMVPSIKRVVRQYFKRGDIVLHRYDVKQRRREFSRLTKARQDAFMEQVTEAIVGLDFRLLVSAIDKRDYLARQGSQRVHDALPEPKPYLFPLALVFLLERLVALLSGEGVAGPVRLRFERLEAKERQIIRGHFGSMLRNGTQYVAGWEFAKWLSHDSLEFIAEAPEVGLQIADWVAMPFAEVVVDPDRYGDTGEWRRYASKIWVGNQAGGGGQVGFKTYPTDLARHLLGLPRQNI